MRTVDVSWDKEAGRFTALGRHPGRSIAINAPALPTEADRGPTGFSATELLLAAAGSCAAWDVVEILRKRRHEISALDVSVESEQDSDPPWTYRRVALNFRIAGDGLKVPVLARVIRLSIVRYCSVITTIAGVAAIAATVELVSPDGSPTGRVPIELALPAIPPPDFVEPVVDEVEPIATDET
ncbi:MAG: putative redox protein [Chloroflexota bacterium]|jgi:putative redox protein|nr:putative redox protein [Chloroflexota bacterium]